MAGLTTAGLASYAGVRDWLVEERAAKTGGGVTGGAALEVSIRAGLRAGSSRVTDGTGGTRKGSAPACTTSVYTELVFEWDPRKAAANAEKHGVSFDLAVTVFLDPDALDGPTLRIPPMKLASSDWDELRTAEC